jgi:hypothetical protein
VIIATNVFVTESGICDGSVMASNDERGICIISHRQLPMYLSAVVAIRLKNLMMAQDS